LRVLPHCHRAGELDPEPILSDSWGLRAERQLINSRGRSSREAAGALRTGFTRLLKIVFWKGRPVGLVDHEAHFVTARHKSRRAGSTSVTDQPDRSPHSMQSGTTALRRQLLQQCLRLLQIERVEPFTEPTIDRSEKLASVLPLALIAPEPRHAHRRAQFPGFGLLLTRDG
jgi:hypothetical protein